jgi:hypothetical protein
VIEFDEEAPAIEFDNFHLAGAVQLLIRREVSKLRRLLKECFHLAGRLKANEELPRRLANDAFRAA